jgi:hypothetical protein
MPDQWRENVKEAAKGLLDHNEGLVQICAGKEEKEREKASFRQVALVRGQAG